VTTIAWDGASLAADKLMGGRHTVCKVFQISKHLWFAGAGDYCQIVEVSEWLKAGSPSDDKPAVDGDSDYLLIDKGKPYWLTVPYLRRVKINEKVAALGSGSMYALGAMAAGADAWLAVKIASSLDPNTGKGITVIKVGRSG